ncbi:glycosyltransferase family 4 protein, partial [bacterium]|nr:glycosyltransferase family 4 protein [bacterium]
VKILMLNANIIGVGTSHRALWFARMCAEAGHEVTVCTTGRTNYWKRNFLSDRPNVTIIEGPRAGFDLYPGNGSNIDIFWRTLYLMKGGFDVIYTFEYHPNVSWPVYLCQKGRRMINDWCDLYAGAANVFKGKEWMHRWDAKREARIRHKADLVTVISDFLGDKAKEIGVPPEKVVLIREGVDTNYMQPFDKTESRTRLGLPLDAKLIVTLQDGAAFPPLIESLKVLREKDPKVALLFVGRMREDQKKLVSEKGLYDAVVTTGFCSDEDLPKNLCAGDVAALPMVDSLANRSRFPHKIGDYIACGLPLAVTDIGEYPLMLKEEDLAAVASPGEAFTDALGELLSNAERREDLSKRAREWVVENLDWQVLKKSIVQCVEGN